VNETDFDWTLAEADIEQDAWGADCAGCARERKVVRRGDNAYCSVHRCRGTAKTGHHAGERCRHHVSGINPLHCYKHACVADWIFSDGSGESVRARCASEGSMQDIPDGRRVRICDDHHRKIWATQPGSGNRS
jgi:hypothetical protein